MDKLNKKLAEWAGFEFSHRNRVKNFFTGALGKFVKFWVYPNGDVNELPDFTQSLDACFKWLVPKLREDQKNWSKFIGMMCGEAKNASRKSRYSRIINWLSDPRNICLAIEKLIDGEKDDSI